MPVRRILIFSHHFSRDPSIERTSWVAMSECLWQAGHEVTVITTTTHGSSEGPWVVNTFDLEAWSSVRGLPNRSVATPSKLSRQLQRSRARWPTPMIVPDGCLLTWCPFALARARQLLGERKIDCVITSGPPHSTHLVALALGQRRPAWIADLRDGWRFQAPRSPWQTRAHDLLDRMLERRTLRAADAVTGATGPITDDVCARLGVLSVHVPNGVDSEGTVERALAHARGLPGPDRPQLAEAIERALAQRARRMSLADAVR